MKELKLKFANIWYHYKFYILIALGILAYIVLTWDSLVPEKPAELSVAIVSETYFNDDQRAALKTELEKEYGTVEVNAYRVALGQTDHDATEEEAIALSSLDADLITGKSSIFLLEDVQAFLDATNGLEISEAVQVKNIQNIAGLGFDELWYVTRK